MEKLGRAKKIFLVIWLINIIILIIHVIIARTINDINVLKYIGVDEIKIILNIYLAFDFLKYILSNGKINTQVVYVSVIAISIPFIVLVIIYLNSLDIYRISEFLFILVVSSSFRLSVINTKTPNYLKLETGINNDNNK